MNLNTCLFIMELQPPLTPRRIQRAYRRMVKRWHPDQFACQPAILAQCEERLKAINQAYAILKTHIMANASGDRSAAHAQAQYEKDCRPPCPNTKPQNEPIWHKRFEQIAKTINHRNQSTPPPGHPGPNSPSSATKNKLDFGHILQEAKGAVHAPDGQPIPAVRTLSRQHLNKHCKQGLRVEGCAPVAAVRPVRPVSGIGAIEGSD